jgi:hypothetical protein
MTIKITEAQVITLLTNILERFVEPYLISTFSRFGISTFSILGIELNERFDRNPFNGVLYPHFTVTYEGYLGLDWKKIIGSKIKEKIKNHLPLDFIEINNTSFIFDKVSII